MVLAQLHVYAATLNLDRSHTAQHDLFTE